MAIPPPLPGGYQLWHYLPSIPGAIIMAIVFLSLTVAHQWFIVRSGKWFCIPLIIGGICKSKPPCSSHPFRPDKMPLVEIVGYAARAFAHYNTTSTVPYAIQSLLILLAPILFAASAYMYLGRIVLAVEGGTFCLVPTRFLTWIFVTGDVVCFLIQAGGGGSLAVAKTTSKVKLGERVILAGLILQIVIFGLFVMVAGFFHYRLRKDNLTRGCNSLPWQRLLLALYLVSALIALRNVIRAIEYGMGSHGYLLTHEWTTFLFDSVPMGLVQITCLFWYTSTVGSSRNVKPSEASQSLQSLRKNSIAPV